MEPPRCTRWSLQSYSRASRRGSASRPNWNPATSLQVRTGPPEPLTYCVRPVNTLIGRHVPDGYCLQLPAVDVDAIEEVPDRRNPRLERSALEVPLGLRSGLVDELLRDPDGPLRQLEVVEAGRRRCQLGAQGLNLEGDALGSAWPGSTKGATQVSHPGAQASALGRALRRGLDRDARLAVGCPR